MHTLLHYFWIEVLFVVPKWELFLRNVSPPNFLKLQILKPNTFFMASESLLEMNRFFIA